MSIQLQGNDESTFANDVTIGDGKITLSGADGSATFNNKVQAGGDATSDAEEGVVITNTGGVYACRANPANPVFRGYRQGTTLPTCQIFGNGSASFAGGIDSVQYVSAARNVTNDNMVIGTFGNENGTKCIIKGDSVRLGTSLNNLNESSNNQNITLNASGSASFSGNLSFPNAFLALDTGGTLDVKERLQNTQAILYRLKAALIQPDADVNTLRQRLLEALDILTSDGDES
jgi:hypothetical protein